MLRHRAVAMMAAALLVPAGASAQTYPAPKDPGKVEPKPKGPHKTYTVCHKKHALRLPHDPEGRQQGTRRRHGPRAQRRLPRGA